MFVIDQKSNSVLPIKTESFSNLGYREREHLQEWIAKSPEVLGESLLIIGKEFDGWAETRERLDLLALDKTGNIVVIENKLDDSGRDVVWQSLKYAAYCSTLKKSDVLTIFRKHLGVHAQEAEARIVDFLEDVEDIDTAEINEGNRQRIILTAAKFRSEVTATCLWLIDHDVDIRCMRITPYSLGETQMINVEQVIPPPEAQDFMVKVGQKKTSESRDSGARGQRKSRRYAFWEQLLPGLTGDAAALFANKSPGRDHWLTGASGISGVGHNFHFLKDRVRYELYAGNTSADINKAVFEQLYSQRTEIENEFGQTFEWKRLDDLKASRVYIEHYLDAYDDSNWKEANDWLDEMMNRAIKVIQPRLKKIKRNL